jgi:hypothetical protein
VRVEEETLGDLEGVREGADGSCETTFSRVDSLSNEVPRGNDLDA